MNSTQTILITSNEPWGDVWFSKHHYANELAALGYRVYFVDAPAEWRLRHLLSFKVLSQNVAPNLTVVTYHNQFPLRFWPRLFTRLNDWLNCWKLSRSLDRSQENGIWWQFDPFRFIKISHFYGYKRIYHVVDPYPHIWSDSQIAQQADLVVITSRDYESSYPALTAAPLYIPHGISQNELQLDSGRLKEIEAKIGNHYIVFIGTINKDVDFNLLLQASGVLRDQTFVLIGPVRSNIGGEASAKFQQLCEQPNVIYLGEQKASELKEYIALAAVGIVPYVADRTASLNRTPLKILNYIAQDKPVVTTINYELATVLDGAVFGVTCRDQFIETLHRVLKGKAEVDIAQLSVYRASVLYPNLIQRILSRLHAKSDEGQAVSQLI